jgi:hypothetical protein
MDMDIEVGQIMLAVAEPFIKSFQLLKDFSFVSFNENF